MDLRRTNWKNKDSAKGPATLDEVRAQVCHSLPTPSIVTNAIQAAAAEREKEVQRIADAQKRGPGGRMPMGRGDARNFSGNQMMPPPQQNSVGMDDLRRLGKAGSRQPSSQGPMSFGPTSMFNTRGSNTSVRKSLGVFGRTGDDSGTSSRTATPPAQKKEKDEKESTNAFR